MLTDTMDDARIGSAIRLLRQRRGWRQVDLAARAGLSQSAISDMERGKVDRYTLAALRRALGALDGRASLDLLWGTRGEVERLLDADHALLVERWASRHRMTGWEVRAEASYSIYGERGRVDLLCYHSPTRTLEVVEAKTGLWEIDATLGRLDAKVRLGREIARPYGWDPVRVVGALVVSEGRTNRRRVGRYPAQLAALGLRGSRVGRFIQDPSKVHADGPAPSGLLAFVSLPGTNHGGHRRAGQRRVRPSGPNSSSPTRSAGTGRSAGPRAVPKTTVVGT